MDGNGRWAQRRHLPRTAGHRAGIKAVRVNAKTGVRAAAGDADTMWEFFKPFEEPDDSYAVIGVTADGGSAFISEETVRRGQQRMLSSGRGNL